MTPSVREVLSNDDLWSAFDCEADTTETQTASTLAEVEGEDLLELCHAVRACVANIDRPGEPRVAQLFAVCASDGFLRAIANLRRRVLQDREVGDE